MQNIYYYKVYDGEKIVFSTKKKVSSSYDLILIKKGTAKLYMRGEIYDIKKGAWMFINDSEPYIYAPDDNVKVSSLMIRMGGRSIKEYYDKFMELNDNVFYLNDQKYEEMFKGIINTIKSKNNTDEGVFENDMLSLLQELVVAEKTKLNEKNANNYAIGRFEKIYEYINANYTEDINLDSICKKFDISRFYLSREFKKKYGKNISDFVRELRIEKAKELIRFTDKKISEVGALCGIYDTNYFVKVFKKETNMTPSEYKYYAYHKGV